MGTGDVTDDDDDEPTIFSTCLERQRISKIMGSQDGPEELM
jgi:hypothetical protein